MGSAQVKITGSESGKKLTLVGLERMDGIGRIFATFWFFIIGFILAYVIFFTDLEYYLKYQYSVFIGQSNLAEKLVTPIMVILISLAFALMLISYLTVFLLITGYKSNPSHQCMDNSPIPQNP